MSFISLFCWNDYSNLYFKLQHRQKYCMQIWDINIVLNLSVQKPILLCSSTIFWILKDYSKLLENMLKNTNAMNMLNRNFHPAASLHRHTMHIPLRGFVLAIYFYTVRIISSENIYLHILGFAIMVYWRPSNFYKKIEYTDRCHRDVTQIVGKKIQVAFHAKLVKIQLHIPLLLLESKMNLNVPILNRDYSTYLQW